jgi:hypothetical protein
MAPDKETTNAWGRKHHRHLSMTSRIRLSTVCIKGSSSPSLETPCYFPWRKGKGPNHEIASTTPHPRSELCIRMRERHI